MASGSYTGTVIRGSGTAAKLGFPTLNIPLADTTLSGIYAAKVEAGGSVYQAAVFADPARALLEAYLLDFSGDLYGKEITIELCKKLRESRRYESDDALSAAIAADVVDTRSYFLERP